MTHFLQNDWLRWYYDYPGQLFRTHKDQLFVVEFDLDPTPCSDLKTELTLVCNQIRDLFPNDRFSVLLSGGSESEILVRMFKQLDLPFDIYIVRYSLDLNIYDVSHAVILCENLNLPYTIIDFDYLHFFENDVFSYSKILEANAPPILAICSILDKIDGIPVLGNGDPVLWRRPADYSNQNKMWYHAEPEFDFGFRKYCLKTNRPAVTEFFRWNHNTLKSFANLKWFNNLISDQFFGKLGTNSTKMQGYQELFPELVSRKKSNGMEKIKHVYLELNRELIKQNGFNYQDVHIEEISTIYKKSTPKSAFLD